MQRLRSWLFYIGMFGSLLLYIPIIPLCLPFPYRIRYALLTRWGQFNLWWLRISCGLGYRVEGAENIPDDAVVVLSKHQSAWETLALQAVLPPQTWVLKRELLWIPLLGWGLALLYAIGIDRGAGRKALARIIEKGTDRLERGINVIVFPEGTRTAPGTHGHYNIGGAMLAAKSGRPVLPVAHNAGEFWPRRGVVKRPGTITVVIGPLIPAEGRKAGVINREVEAWIEGTMRRISQVTYPDERA